MTYEERVAAYSPILPSAQLHVESISPIALEAIATDEQIAKLKKKVSSREVHGPLVKISDGFLIDNPVFDGGEIIRARLINFVDDPFLASLPANAPRAVKAIYRKEVMLKHLRCGDAGVQAEDENAAELAWAKWFEITDAESAPPKKRK